MLVNAVQGLAVVERNVGTETAWLALFAADAIVEDPIGPSRFDPARKI